MRYKTDEYFDIKRKKLKQVLEKISISSFHALNKCN